MSILRTVTKFIPLFMCFWALIILCGCKKDQQNVQYAPSSTKYDAVAASRVLATIADDEKPGAPSEHDASKNTGNQLSELVIELNSHGKGVAYIAKIDNRSYVVHNGKRGTSYDKIESYSLILSPDGQRIAYGAQRGEKEYIVVDGVEKGPFADIGGIAFSPDSKHVAYEAQIGTRWYMYADNNVILGSGLSYYNRSVFSRDSSKLSYIENTDVSGVYRLNISDLKSKQKNVFTIADPVVVINSEKTVVAAVEKHDGKWNIISFDFNHPDKIISGEQYDDIKQLTISDDGMSLAYIASKDGKSYICLNEKRELLPVGNYPWPFVIRPDNKRVGIFIANAENNKAYLHHAFAPAGHKNKTYKEGAHLVYSSDNMHYAFVAIENEKFTIVVDGKEGPFFERTTSPHFSPDSNYLVYRARQDNKRFVVIADLSGKILKRLPSYERVFDTTFTEDGKSVAYGVKDGNQIAWKVEALR